MSGPATQPPVLATVRVRMYQVGFGDCFLLSFEYAGQAEPARHVLIDFGSRQLAAGLDLADIAGEIDARTGGGPDVVVLTHRHQDHMSGFGGSGTDAVVGRWQPRLVVRSWTEDPAAPADAPAPAGPGGTGLRAGLDRGGAFATALSRAIAASARGLRADVRELALAQLANQAAIDRLNAWSRTGQGVYVSYGQPLALDAVVPGVRVQVIGPPPWPSTRRWPGNVPRAPSTGSSTRGSRLPAPSTRPPERRPPERRPRPTIGSSVRRDGWSSGCRLRSCAHCCASSPHWTTR